MLWQYAGRPAPPNLLLPFGDAEQASPWAADALRWVVDRGILSDRAGGVLDPTGTATRAEAAQIWYARRGIRVECVQTDNGFEFTNRFSNSKRNIQTLFEKTAAELGVQHKLIRPYTPRHNGKVEHSHREDQKRFYSVRSFFSLADFQKQLAVHNRRSNNLPMRLLHWLSPLDFLVQSL